MGIEPTQPAWKAGILPLNYTRIFERIKNYITKKIECKEFLEKNCIFLIFLFLLNKVDILFF